MKKRRDEMTNIKKDVSVEKQQVVQLTANDRKMMEEQ